ncbi:Fc.00g033230.m01.CDS01 [Cosmosporella sp. VM-42]
MDPEELQAHTEKLQVAARAAHGQRVPFQNIHPEHHCYVLDRAIKNILSTEPAQFTYAQIID